MKSTSKHTIAYPEVPIALRLSTHLLGIVQIYLLKANYLLQDCNSIKGTIRTVFPAARIDLPPDADQPLFEFSTKPDNFQLDAFELDDGILDVNGKDVNVTTYSQITMTSQGPGEEDPYAVFRINEAMIMNPSHNLVANSNAIPMDVDVMPPFDLEIIEVLVTPPHEDVAAKNHGLGNEAYVSHPSPNVGRSPQDPPEAEVMRDTVNSEGINRPDSDYTNENDGIDRLSDPTIEQILDDRILSIQSGGIHRYLVRWKGCPLTDDTCHIREELQKITLDLLEQYDAITSHSTKSNFFPSRENDDIF